MKCFLAVIILLFSYNISNAQSSPEQIIDKFFDVYKKEDSSKAIDYLFSNNQFSVEIADGLDDVKRQLKKQIDADGKFYGRDLLSKRSAGPNLIMYTYIVRHAREPLTFNIMFYKASDKWQLQNFKFHNNTDDELEEASKAYRLVENFKEAN